MTDTTRQLSKFAFFAVVFLLIGVAAGCSQNASVVSASDAKAAVQNLTYAKDDRTGVCYAIIATRGTGEVHQNGMTITYVPCTPEVLAQIAKQ